MNAGRTRLRFRSLRWRIATFYALLLVCVVAIVGVVLTFQLRTILLDEARAKVDRVGEDISQTVRGNSLLSALGEGLPVEEQLTASGSLDHWAGPTTYVEVDTASGYPVGKSTNMGGATFSHVAFTPKARVVYRTETSAALGPVFVRSEAIRAPNVELDVSVGESLAVYDETLDRIRSLLAIVVLLAAVVVIGGSVALASSAIGPIDRLIAATREIRFDTLSRRVGSAAREDEIGELSRSFDAMLDRLEDGFARERQFISDASHELRTPLTVIDANAQMLERWADDDPAIRAESIRAIRGESSSLAAMVDGMLVLAKAESGDDLPREAVDLSRALDEVAASTRPRALEKGLAFAVRGTGGAATVLGDANLLRQLLRNLIENAIKFTESGSIQVALENAGDRVVVTVADTGIGIDADAHERVFDRFYRTDVSRDRSVPGTGLGLSIVRSIARVHEGRVSAASRPGGGTIFTVDLPALTPRS